MGIRGAHTHPQASTVQKSTATCQQNAPCGRSVGCKRCHRRPALAPHIAPTAAALADGRPGHRVPQMCQSCVREAPNECQWRVSRAVGRGFFGGSWQLRTFIGGLKIAASRPEVVGQHEGDQGAGSAQNGPTGLPTEWACDGRRAAASWSSLCPRFGGISSVRSADNVARNTAQPCMSNERVIAGRR